MTQLPIEVRILENSVRTFLFGQHLPLYLLDRDFCVPDFRCVVHFAPDIVAFFHNRVEFLDEKVVAVDFGHPCGETEVGNNELSLAVDQKIFWLDVTVDDAVVVEVLDSLDQLRQNVTGHLLIKPISVLNETVEFSELGQLHDVVAEVCLAFDNDPLADGLGLLDGLDQFLPTFSTALICLMHLFLAAIRPKT